MCFIRRFKSFKYWAITIQYALKWATIHKYLYYTILQFTTWQITFTAATNMVYHELKVHPKIEYCDKFCEENPHITQ